jgi:hypothetical protein
MLHNPINLVPTISQNSKRREVDARIKHGFQGIALSFQEVYLRWYLRCGERCPETYHKVEQKKPLNRTIFLKVTVLKQFKNFLPLYPILQGITAMRSPSLAKLLT